MPALDPDVLEGLIYGGAGQARNGVRASTAIGLSCAKKRQISFLQNMNDLRLEWNECLFKKGIVKP